MCGRFASFLPPEALRAIFRTLNPLPNAAPSWNLAPTNDALVVRRNPETGERHLDPLRWGLIPRTAKDVKGERTTRPINARAETVARSGLFADSFAKRRCLVPADAFYEWKTLPDGKQPFAVARQDGAPLALGGIWSAWQSPATGEITRSFAIITTAANATMRPLHDRIPLILEPDDWPRLGWGKGRVNAPPAGGSPLGLLRPTGEDVLRHVRSAGPSTTCATTTWTRWTWLMARTRRRRAGRRRTRNERRRLYARVDRLPRLRIPEKPPGYTDPMSPVVPT